MVVGGGTNGAPFELVSPNTKQERRAFPSGISLSARPRSCRGGACLVVHQKRRGVGARSLNPKQGTPSFPLSEHAAWHSRRTRQAATAPDPPASRSQAPRAPQPPPRTPARPRSAPARRPRPLPSAARLGGAAPAKRDEGRPASTPPLQPCAVCTAQGFDFAWHGQSASAFGCDAPNPMLISRAQKAPAGAQNRMKKDGGRGGGLKGARWGNEGSAGVQWVCMCCEGRMINARGSGACLWAPQQSRTRELPARIPPRVCLRRDPPYPNPYPTARLRRRRGKGSQAAAGCAWLPAQRARNTLADFFTRDAKFWFGGADALAAALR